MNTIYRGILRVFNTLLAYTSFVDETETDNRQLQSDVCLFRMFFCEKMLIFVRFLGLRTMPLKT